MKWLLTASKPSPAFKATTLLYLHGVGISASTRLRVRDIDFTSNPAKIVFDGSRTVYVTDELSSVLKGLATERSDDDLLLGYESVPGFHADFRRMVQSSKLVRFDLSDIKEMFKSAAGNNLALLKGHESEEPHTPQEIKAIWLKVLPRSIVATGEASEKSASS